MCLGLKGGGHKVKVCWVELKNDLELRCSINPAHECLPTGVQPCLVKRQSQGCWKCQGRGHADELPFKDIRGRHAFQVKDEPGTIRLGPV